MNDLTKTRAINTIDYQDAKRIARDGDMTERCALASRKGTRPEILYYLAEDPDAEVRRRIAENDETPRHADMLLAQDECEEVRSLLASKIGRLFPEVSVTERNVMRRAVLDILEVLAADETERIREILSDTLKDDPNVPPHVVRQLAADPLLTVCGPILEFSPVLTEEDLLELISSKPVQGALSAISRRATVGESVSDAIAESHDSDAIANLLANPSAQIREETLDSLIDGAAAVEAWHKPLVNRPTLPVTAAKRIAGFVAQSLLDTLRQRTDLEADVLDAVADVVSERLQEDTEKKPSEPLDPSSGKKKKKEKSAIDLTNALEHAQKLHQSGKLSEKTIGDAAAAGDTAFVVAALSLCSGEDAEVIQRIFDMRSTKGIVSVCWKASMSMELAVRLQFTLGNIAPGAILNSDNSPDYPLSVEEMRWQLEFFKSDF